MPCSRAPWPGHFKEARQALDDPNGRWGDGDPVPRRFTAEQLTELVEGAGLTVGAVHGVRVFADLVPGVLVDTEPGALEALLKLEEAAAELPAFHSVATQLHVLGETAGDRRGPERRLSRAVLLIRDLGAHGVRHRPPDRALRAV